VPIFSWDEVGVRLKEVYGKLLQRTAKG